MSGERTRERAREAVHVEANMDRRIEAQAQDALRELWDARAKLGEQTGNPHDRLVTLQMVKDAVERRLRDFLPRGSLMPIVRVDLNARRTGFVIDIRPGHFPTDLDLPLIRKS